MGESDRYQEYKIRKQRFTLGQSDNALMWLFVFNVIFFLVLQTIKISFYVYEQLPNAYNNDVVRGFQLPATISGLGQRPWTAFSYMFSDIVLFRAISNMLWLWAFGSILQNATGNKKIIAIYLYGGLAGALFFMVAGYLMPAQPGLVPGGLLGANAAVMAVAITATMIAPNYRFFRMLRGGIPIWVLTILYVGIDLTDAGRQSPVVALAHIGGAAAGFLFVLFLRNGKDGSVWMYNLYYWFINLFNPNKKLSKYSAKEKVFYNTGNRKPFSKTSNVTEQRVDEILDKINQKGYKYLTEEEKNILKKASED